MANICFQRFLPAREMPGCGRSFRFRTVNDAGDFVILCRERARRFLGYTFETLHCIGGTPCLGGLPSDKSASKYRETVRMLVSADQTSTTSETGVAAVNDEVRGYWNEYCL